MTPTPEEISEAEALRYTRSVIRLIPLKSGRFAVLVASGAIVGYAASLEEAVEITRAAYASWDRNYPNAKLGFVSRKAKLPSITLDISDFEI